MDAALLSTFQEQLDVFQFRCHTICYSQTKDGAAKLALKVIFRVRHDDLLG